MSMKQTMCEFVHGMKCDEVCKFLGEIVRCRDCKKLNIVGECPCGFWALENLNGFCAWGERRDADKRFAIEDVLCNLVNGIDSVEFDAMTAIEKATKDIMEIMGGESSC